MKKICSLLLLLLTHHALFSQDFTSALANFQSKNPQEKIYIHFDKDSYVAGETIWFKAYLLHNGMPSFLSTNFYVQLTDIEGSVVSSGIYPVNGATVKGSIALSDSILQGNYIVRAYTPATLNFTDEHLSYKKSFAVYHPNAKAQSTPTAPALSLRFFPESGQMIHGITTVVAFKVQDANGLPVQTAGMIKTANGFTIPFRTTHNGMGKVSFRPDAAKTYTAVLDNHKQEFALPAVQKSGILLHVEDEKGGKVFTLTRSTADKNNFQKVYVVAQINNQVVYEQEIDFEDYPSLKGHLVTDKLSSGILHFTVFNKDGAPLAERMTFVDNREYMAATGMDVVKKNLQKRGENNVDIVYRDSLQKTLSVSITDNSATDPQDRQSIIAQFLLSSDLKGYIYNAAGYFDKPYDSVKNALDLLMLTHGWSRFSWKKILANELAQKKYDAPYLFTVKGVLKDDKGKEVKGGQLNVYIESEDSTSQSYDVDVSNRGSFILDSLLFFGRSKFYYSYFEKGKYKPVNILLDSTVDAAAGYLHPRDSSHIILMQISQADIARRYQFSKDLLGKSKVLETVVLESKSNKRPVDLVNEKYSSGAFRAPAKVNLDNVNQPTPNKTLNPVDYAMNNIRLLEMQNGRLVNNRTMSLQSGEKWAVALFLDEVPADLAILRTLRMDEIALIKYYEPGFVGAGSSGPGGALAVYTKHAKEEKPKATKLDYVEYKGYTITREFYHPDYSKPEPRHDLADQRSTLYWNPDIYFDGEGGKTAIRFFNNDYSKKLRVVIEGFAADGKLVHIEKIIAAD